MRTRLHTYTIFSDGELLPAELARRAKVAGYRAIAITNHADACGRVNPVGERSGAGTHTRRGVPASRIACPSGRRTVPAEDHSDLRPERKPAGGLPPPVPVEPALISVRFVYFFTNFGVNA